MVLTWATRDPKAWLPEEEAPTLEIARYSEARDAVFLSPASLCSLVMTSGGLPTKP